MVSDEDEPGVKPDFSTEKRTQQPLTDPQLASIHDLRLLSFQYMQDGFSILDENGLHVEVNPAFCAMTGFAREELIGSTPEHSYWPPEEREKIQIALDNTLKGEFSELELTFMRKNGERFPAQVVPFSIRDNRGRTMYYAATVKDSTETVKMQGALNNSEKRYHKLFDSAGDAILIMKEDRLIDCNKRTLELYSCSLDQFLSLPATTFFPPTQPNGQSSTEFFEVKIEAAARTGMPQFFEWTGRRIDGMPVNTEVTLTMFTLDNTQYTQSIVRDITQRKKMEEALVDLNKTLEDRVANRTEELEEAYAELLQRTIHYRELATKLTQAEEKERKRIAQLLHDNHQQLLVAAKFRMEILQSGPHKPDVQNAAGEVLEILDEVVEITRSLTLELAPPILSGSGLVIAIQWLARRMEEEHELKVDVYGSLPSTRISTDVSDILLRSSRELLFNVVKHADVKQARVNIAIIDQQLFLVVEDEGKGYDLADTLEPTKAYGLFSIQEQLSVLDGQMDISSAPQRGTRCTISIPVAAAFIVSSEVSPNIDGSTAPVDTSPVLQGPIRILIADDHTLVRKALVQTLSLVDDFEVIGEAVDGLDAIAKVRTLKPDIVLLDVNMPQVNGIEATLTITSEDSNVRIIGLSMHPSDEMESRMLAAGAASYLQKLTPVEQLFTTIRAVMNK